MPLTASAATGSLAAYTCARFFSAANAAQGITCTTSSITTADASNPVPPGMAAETVSSQTFGGCTINVTGTTGINSITTDVSSDCPWQATIDVSANPSAVTIAANGGAG